MPTAFSSQASPFDINGPSLGAAPNPKNMRCRKISTPQYHVIMILAIFEHMFYNHFKTTGVQGVTPASRICCSKFVACKDFTLRKYLSADMISAHLLRGI